MSNNRIIHTFFILLYMNTQIVLISTECADLDKDVLIQNPTSLYYLEGYWDDNLLRVRTFYNTTTQHWRFQPSSTIGLFNIINVRTEEALDLSAYDQGIDSFNVTITLAEDTLTQRWFLNSDGTIANAVATNYILDVKDGNYSYANYMVLTPRHENDTSIFVIEREETL